MSDQPTLIVVGLGPGDPELVTIKGMRAIEQADVIFVPRSKDDADSVALRIAEPWLTARQQVIPVTTPMTRDEDKLKAAWQGVAAEIAQQLLTGQGERCGAYLILGDPLIYGTFTYIAEILRAQYPAIKVEFIPGITSFSAGAARLQTPLSMTSDRIAIVPASRETDVAVLRRLLADFATVILMKAGPVFPGIMAVLEELGLADRAAYVERVGMPEERIFQGAQLRQMPRERQPYLSLMIVRRDGPIDSDEARELLRATRSRQTVYPINLSDLSGKRVVVVGGGSVGQRKVKGLLAVNARVELVSPDAAVQLQQWATEKMIIWHQRRYQAGDLAGAALVFAATSDRSVNTRIAREAAAIGLLSNIADAPEEGDFYLPAVYRQAEVMVTVSTSGQDPGRAAALRDTIAEWMRNNS
jgi:precorrin-2/cobalt-factor-2 C20-methyltransferase